MEEFVDHLSFLGKMSSEMPALEKEYAIVTKLYTIARDFDVVIPPEELALYQTLAPSFQHLKVREPPDRKPNPLHAKLFFYNHKNLLAFCIIFQHWYGAGGWNPSPRRTKDMTHLSYAVNTRATDDLATQGTNASKPIHEPML